MAPKTEFTKATSEVPGPGASAQHDYANHLSGLARMYVWRPDGPFVNAKVLLFEHGGLWHNMGDGACSISSLAPPQDNEFHQLCLALHEAGWVIVSIDFPPSPSNIDTVRNVSPTALFPEPELFTGIAISHLRDHWTGEAGQTKFGEKLFGTGNSIDRQGIVGIGPSSGGTSMLFNGFVPDGHFAHMAGTLAMTYDPLAPRSSHRPNAVISAASQPDWTQFHIEDKAPDGTPYHSDIHQHFADPSWARRWSKTAMNIKQAASPAHWLAQGFAVNRSMPVYATWPDEPQDSNGVNLTAADFQPGRVLKNVAGGKAYTNPHHPFVALPFSNLLQQYADPRSRVWGMGVANGPATAAGKAAEWLDWLSELGFISEPVTG